MLKPNLAVTARGFEFALIGSYIPQSHNLGGSEKVSMGPKGKRIARRYHVPSPSELRQHGRALNAVFFPNCLRNTFEAYGGRMLSEAGWLLVPAEGSGGNSAVGPGAMDRCRCFCVYISSPVSDNQ
jgi:hypothetical protein